MQDKKKVNHVPNNSETEIKPAGMGESYDYDSYRHRTDRAVYENAGTDTTKPFDITLMTGHNTSNGGNKK